MPVRINTNSALLRSGANQELIRRSFRAWSNQTCTDLVFQFDGATTGTAEFDPDVGASNENVVIATDTPAQTAELIGEPNLLAITLTSFSVQTGEILDADIVINAAGFRFENVTDVAACQSQATLAFDLENTMVHEVGHFIGFDHTTDREATMFESAAACETLKRDLAATDLNGLCTVYEDGMPPQTCNPADDYGVSNFLLQFRDQCAPREGGCTCVAGAEHPDRATKTWLWGLLPLFGLASWRLRRRRSL